MAAAFIFPQEIEVTYIIPSLRRELAVAMKESGLTQREKAKKLMVTEQAVSQYFSSKRASTVEFNDKVKQEIKRVAQTLDEDNFKQEMLNLLKLSLKENITCQVCTKITKTHNNCEVCFEG